MSAHPLAEIRAEPAALTGRVARQDDVQAIRTLLSAYGPYQPMKPAVDFMDSAPVTGEERHKLYHANAERIFRIDPA